MKDSNSEAELAQLFDIIRVDSNKGAIDPIPVQTMDDVNREVFWLICKQSREYATLVALRQQQKINEDDFKSQRKILFHKLVGQYNAALRILQVGIPLDSGVFESIIVDDKARKTIFELLEKEDLSVTDYLIADAFCISEVLDLYGEEIFRRKESGEPVDDQTHLFT